MQQLFYVMYYDLILRQSNTQQPMNDDNVLNEWTRIMLLWSNTNLVS